MLKDFNKKQEERVRTRFDEYFYDSEHSLTPNQVKHIWTALIKPLLKENNQLLMEEVGEKIQNAGKNEIAMLWQKGKDEIGDNWISQQDLLNSLKDKQ